MIADEYPCQKNFNLKKKIKNLVKSIFIIYYCSHTETCLMAGSPLSSVELMLTALFTRSDNVSSLRKMPRQNRCGYVQPTRNADEALYRNRFYKKYYKKHIYLY